MSPERVFILPGWQNSGPEHWQSRWQHRWGFRRVEQFDWLHPRRGDWAAQLNAAVADAGDGHIGLVAHSLGCILLAWWAAHAGQDLTSKIRAALLVAPGDVQENALLREKLIGWCPIAQNPLPFSATVVASKNDPFCSLHRSQYLAAQWGAKFVNVGLKGHINADSGLGDWDEGKAIFDAVWENAR